MTDIYTVPGSTVVSLRVIITNRSGNKKRFRISLAPNGAADSDEQYVAFDKLMESNDTGSTIAFVLDSGDVVRVYGETTEVSFTATGEERPA